MTFLFPILAAILQAGSLTLDKVVLSIRRVNFKTYTGVSFPLIFLSFVNLLFALRTNSYFSVDDFAVLAYLKNHNILQMSLDFLINGDVFGFRKLTGYVFFGLLFKTFGVNNYAFDAFMFLTNTANLIIIFLIVKSELHLP